MITTDTLVKNKGIGIEQRQLPAPGQETADRIWQMIVGVFVVVLAIAAGSLAAGRFVAITPATGAIFTGNDTIVTIFTTSSAFLIGLLAPSPVKGGQGG